MRNIPANILTELQSSELRPFMLLQMTIDGTAYRYTDCDVPIHETNLYEPRAFQLDPVKYSTASIVDYVSFEIDDLDDVLKPPFIAGTAQGSEAILSAVVLDSDYAVVDSSSIIMFEGEIDKWSLDEKTIKVTVASQFVRWSQNTLNRHGASCRWKKFKGVYCGYSGGGTWCDRTYARCEALGNEDNFGGFRWLPSMADKDIWWGRSRG